MKIWRCATFTLSLALSAQTRIAPAQHSTLPQAPAPLTDTFCPGTALQRNSNTEIVVGASWSSEAPCQLHFSGFNLQQVSKGGTIKLLGPTILDDEVYLFYKYPNPPATQIATLRLAAKNIAQYDLTSCQDCMAQAMPKPAFDGQSVPVGVWLVRNGKFTDAGYVILDRHQLYIAGDVGVTLQYSEGGYLFQLATQAVVVPTAVASQMKAAIQDAAAEQATAVKKMMTLPMLQPVLKDQELQMRLESVETRMNEVTARSVHVEDMQDMIGRLTTALGDLHKEVDELRDKKKR